MLGVGPSPLLLHHALEAAALADPHAIAVESQGERVTYATLAGRAGEIAATLQDLGVAHRDLVAVCLRRGVEAVATWFGVLTAGATYVPIDAGTSLVRLRAILREGQVRWLVALAERSELGEVGGAGVTVVWDRPVSGAPSLASAGSRRRAATATTEDDPAYVYFTSGSTGRPKGAVMSHGTALSYMRTVHSLLKGQPADVIANHAAFAFDLAAFDVHYAVHCGAAVTLIPEAARLVPEQLLRHIDEQGATILYTVPTTLRRIAAASASGQREVRSLRALVFAGEAPEVGVLRAIRPLFPEATFHHWYGSTEAPLVTAAAFGPTESLPDILPIGRPVESVLTAIERDGELVSLASGPCSGELLVAGPLVMNGYCSATRPSDDGFYVATGPGSGGKRARWFRTRDLVEVDDHGRCFYAGRIDRMVKVNGLRVDLGEVEVMLSQGRGVRECAVIALPDAASGVRLCGFAVGVDLDTEALRDELHTKLPPHMVPGQLVAMHVLPRTGSGKIDRTALAREQGTGSEVAEEQQTVPERSGRARERIDARTLILECVVTASRGRAHAELGDEVDLVRSGLLDSLEYVALLGMISERLGHELDVSRLSHSSYATVGGLTRLAGMPPTSTAAGPLDLSHLNAALEAVGIRRDDRILVHAGIGVFGVPRGGVAMYADALLERIGPRGLLAVPTFTFGFCRGQPFDRERTPSEGMGALAEYVRRLTDAHRTPHAMQSLAAIGQDAQPLAAIDTRSAYEEGSAFAELERMDVKVLLLGAAPIDISMVHLCEERARVPYRYFKEFTGQVRLGRVESQRSYVLYARHRGLDPRGRVPRVANELERRGQWRETRLRGGTLAACSVRDFTAAAADLLAHDPFVLLENADAVRAYVDRHGPVTPET